MRLFLALVALSGCGFRCVQSHTIYEQRIYFMRPRHAAPYAQVVNLPHRVCDRWEKVKR
jgi:hypothetical protein